MGVSLQLHDQKYRTNRYEITLPAVEWTALGERVGGVLASAVSNWSIVEGYDLAALATEATAALSRMNPVCLEEKDARATLRSIVVMAEETHVAIGFLAWH